MEKEKIELKNYVDTTLKKLDENIEKNNENVKKLNSEKIKTDKDIKVYTGEVIKIDNDKTLSEITKQQKELEQNNNFADIFNNSYDNSIKAVKGIDDIKNSIDENKELVNKNNELLETMINNQSVIDQDNKKLYQEMTEIKKLIGSDNLENPQTLFQKMSKLSQDVITIRKETKKIQTVIGSDSLIKDNEEPKTLFEKVETSIKNDKKIYNKINENKTDIENVFKKLLGLVDYIKKPFYKKFF